MSSKGKKVSGTANATAAAAAPATPSAKHSAPRVAILMGSDSDLPTMRKCMEQLDKPGDRQTQYRKHEGKGRTDQQGNLRVAHLHIQFERLDQEGEDQPVKIGQDVENSQKPDNIPSRSDTQRPAPPPERD